MSSEDIPVDSWLAVIHAIEVADGSELRKIFPTFVGFREQGEMCRVLPVKDFLFLRRTAGSEVDLASEYGLDARTPAGLVEIDGPVKVPMVGHGNGRHAQFGGTRGQLLGADHPVEQGVGSVKVKMDEGL